MSTHDRVAWALFIILLLFCAVLVATLRTEEKPSLERPVANSETNEPERVRLGHGVPHPTIPGMLHGGDAKQRSEGVFNYAAAFATLCMLLFTGLLILGLCKPGGFGPGFFPVLQVGLVSLVVVGFLFGTYSLYVTDGGGGSLLGFPSSTAWLLLGVWGFPVLLSLVGLLIFDRWYITSEALERVRAIAAENRDAAQSSQES